MRESSDTGASEPGGAQACPACGASVGEGRLSCPECGTLLAATGGSASRPSGDVESALVSRPPPPAAAAAARPAPPAGPVPAASPPSLEPSARGSLPVSRDAVAAPDARPLPPGQWYSERFRAAATGQPLAPETETQPPVRAGSAGLFSDLPIAAPSAPIGWFSVLGSWLLVLAFLLPWAPNLDYFSAWGVGVGRNFMVLIASVVVALLTVLPLRIPDGVRLGLLPLLLGAFCLGLAWYQLSFSQAPQVGFWLFLVGGLMAAGGGAYTALRSPVERAADET